MSIRKTLGITGAVLALSIIGFAADARSAGEEAGTTHTDSAYTPASGSRLVRLNGGAQRAGNGTVRAYIVVDESAPDVPLEIGVALSEQALDGLPAPAPKPVHHDPNSGEHVDMHNWILDLPTKNPTPYQFVQFGWNPAGHEPPGVWDVPHFDFHFYEVPIAVRNSILPSDPQFKEKAANYPPPEFNAPFYVDAATAAKAPPYTQTVPEMGMHWIDVRTPEVQAIVGNPAGYKPFTRTFIYGSWDGRFIFGEPMITRAHILEKKTTTDPAVRDEVIPVSLPGKVAVPGYYPQAYRIMWDASTKEYRISLTRFAKRD